jgi:hypothetical protein
VRKVMTNSTPKIRPFLWSASIRVTLHRSQVR